MNKTQTDIACLITYAKLDRELGRMMAMLEDMPEDLKRDSDALKEESESLSCLQQDLDNWEKERRDLELEQATDIEKRSEREQRLNSIQNMKEHQAALKEIEEAKRRLKMREETLAALIEKITQAKTEQETLVAKQTELDHKVTERTEALGRERDTLKHDIDSKRHERDQYAAHVSTSLLKKYEHISRLRQPALAIVDSGVCGECYMQLPPQQYIELQRSQSFMVCPSCQRLLYIEIQSQP